MSYTLTINSNRGELSVSWNDVDNLAYYANFQSGFYLQKTQSFEKELLHEHFQKWNQMFWDQRQQQGMFDYSDGDKILDIGSGISVVDLLLYSYIPNSTFYLLDNQGWDEKFAEPGIPSVSYSEKYPFYHSWDPVSDAIKTSKFDPDRFIFLNSDSKFPEDLDVVTSYLSWCFHYPKEVYWDKVIDSLKIGGKLIVDIRPLHNKDIMGEISESFKSNPITFTFPKVEKYVDDFDGPDPTVTGYRCMWIRKV